MSEQLKLTYIGGPTALLEFGGVRLLTDPTFDAAPRALFSGALYAAQDNEPGD